MFGPTNQPPKSKVQVLLDGKAIELSPDQSSSLASIRAHLESIALRERRMLFGFTVDGTPVNLNEPLPTVLPSRAVEAITITFSQLSQHLIWMAGYHVDRLIVRVDQISLLVMINDWKVAQRMWWELLPELKAPLISLNYLPELLEKSPGALTQKNLDPFIAQVNELRKLLIDIDDICCRRDLLAFSDALEKRLGLWLREMSTFLKMFHEHSA